MLYFLQVFKRVSVFDKLNYTAENRKNIFSSGVLIESSKGYYQDEVLYLPEEIKDSIHIQNTHLVLIIDSLVNHSKYSFRSENENSDFPVSLNNQEKSKSIEIFDLRRNNDGFFEIFLNYEKHAFFLGVPKRQNHKIADLKPNKCFSFLINGKSDFTMTGRKQRTFYEHEYFFEAIKPVNQIEFKAQDKLSFLKEKEKSNCKIINERKILS